MVRWMMVAAALAVGCSGGDDEARTDSGGDTGVHDHDDHGSDTTDDTRTTPNTTTSTSDAGSTSTSSTTTPSTTSTTDTATDSTSTGAMTWTGSFVPADYPASGTARLEQNGATQTLHLENFRTSNGPDLRLYLSTNRSDADFVDLGALQGIDGDYVYTVPAGTDVTTHDHVLIWCEDFSVLFGFAVLAP